MGPSLHIWIIILLAFTAHRSNVFSQAEEVPEESDDTGNETLNWNKTGIPQIDYVNDPNLPRELNGYNLSAYPFFNKVPKNINFSCTGLKDGFYASVEHKCQLYHHCLFGTRYDFLCANYTAFDQRTFICTFVSDVDCPNSALFYHRNDALYISPTTSTIAPPVFSGIARRVRPALPPKEITESHYTEEDLEEIEPTSVAAHRKANAGRNREKGVVEERRQSWRALRSRCGPRRRRRCRRPRPRRPVQESYYYDYDDDYYDDQYDEEKKYPEYDVDYELEEVPKRRKSKQKIPVSQVSTSKKSLAKTTPSPTTTEPAELDAETLLTNRDKIFSQQRNPPKIRPPVPKQGGSKGAKPVAKVANPSEIKETDYYEYDDEDDESSLPTTVSTTTTTGTTTSKPKFSASKASSSARRAVVSRTTTLPPAVYEYEYEDAEEEGQEPQTTVTKPPVGRGRHYEINGALEAPSNPSLRQPYLNRPRPSATTLAPTTLYYDSTNSNPELYLHDVADMSPRSPNSQRFWQRSSTTPLPFLSTLPFIAESSTQQNSPSPRGRYGQAEAKDFRHSPYQLQYNERASSNTETSQRPVRLQRRQPSSTDHQLKRNVASPSHHYISLAQDDEVYYYPSEQTQNIQVQIRPRYEIPEYPELHETQPTFGHFRGVRSSYNRQSYPYYLDTSY